MNAPVDTLGFAQSFEEAGFDPRQARALAAAFGRTYDAARENLVTREVLRAELAEFKTELNREMADLSSGLQRQMSDLNSGLQLQMAELSSGLQKQMAELGSGVQKQLAELGSGVQKQLADMKLELTKEIGAVGREAQGRLWSTVAVIASVSTAISATVGAAVTLLLKAGGL